MIQILWSVLNITLGIYFLFLIINFIAKGKRIFNHKFKFFSIAVLIIGFVQIVFATNSEEKNNKIIFKDYIPQTSQKIKIIKAEEGLSFDIILFIKYVKEDNELILVESSSSTIGFVSGFNWEYKFIQTSKDKVNNNFAFTANGILRWELFGFNIYSQNKTFSGTIE